MRHGRSIVRVFCVPAPTVRQILPHDYIALTDSRAQTMISRAFSAILRHSGRRADQMLIELALHSPRAGNDHAAPRPAEALNTCADRRTLQITPLTSAIRHSAFAPVCSTRAKAMTITTSINGQEVPENCVLVDVRTVEVMLGNTRNLFYALEEQGKFPVPSANWYSSSGSAGLLVSSSVGRTGGSPSAITSRRTLGSAS